MNTLHLYRRPLQSEQLERLLSLCQADDGILLLHDASYSLHTAQLQQKIQAAKQTFYCLHDDIAARQLTEQLTAAVTLIDYQQFVTLTLDYDKTISW